MDCDDDRLKKGIDDGVRRLVEGFRRTDEDGLKGALGGTGGTFVLALEAVSARLEMNRSGVLEGPTGWPAGDSGPRVEPIDDKEAKEVAEAIASELIGDQSSAEAFDGEVGEKAFSFDIDFRICCPKDMARGLVTGDLAASFIEELDGVDDSFLPSALEKLHFLDGVLCKLVGVVDLGTCSELCLDGVVGKAGTSRVVGKVTSLNVSLLLRSGTSPCSTVGGGAAPGDARGDLYVESSFGSGGTGGT